MYCWRTYSELYAVKQAAVPCCRVNKLISVKIFSEGARWWAVSDKVWKTRPFHARSPATAKARSASVVGRGVCPYLPMARNAPCGHGQLFWLGGQLKV